MSRQVIAQLLRAGPQPFVGDVFIADDEHRNTLWLTDDKRFAQRFDSAAQVYELVKRLRPKDGLNYYQIQIHEEQTKGDEDDDHALD